MFRRLHLLAFSFIFNAELFFLVELSIRLKKKGKKSGKGGTRTWELHFLKHKVIPVH